MRLIENTLYLELPELVESGISENYLRKAKSTGTKCWHFIDDPLDKRKVLVGWNELKPNYKKMVTERYGDPFEYIAKQPIRKLVALDHKAEQFFITYRYEGDKFLPIEHRTKYTTAASWLNMLLKVNEDKKIIKKELRLTLDQFWSNVTDIIKVDKIDLPTSYQRLRNKMAEYKANGYQSLIDWRFGNKLSAKIGKSEEGFNPELAEKQIAFIRKAASRHNNFDTMQITRAVNQVFDKQGWPQVSNTTVYNLIARNEHLIASGRRGKRTYDNTIAMQVKRKRPDMPLMYATLDGWTVELAYQERNSYHNRLVMVVVLDAMNNYPLGWAIGERENTDLIKQAGRNAMIHINELFGAPYRPWQIQSDRYGIKVMTPFFQAMSHLYTPAAAGNAKAKVIEPYFNYLNSNYCQRMFNWTGHNLDSKKDNQPNREFLDKIKQTFPDRDGVIKQIQAIMMREREIKQPDFIQRWELVAQEDKVLIAPMDQLMLFGRPTGYQNALTGQGLIVTINGEKLVYDSFDSNFRAMQNTKWQVIYDDANLEEILVISEDNKTRFLLQQKRLVPMDVRSMKPEDHKYLSQVRQFNKTRYEEVIQVSISDGKHVDEIMSNTMLDMDNYDEASLKLMFTVNGQQKEALQDAKGLRRVKVLQQKKEDRQDDQQQQNWQQLQQDYLTNKTDLSQYLD